MDVLIDRCCGLDVHLAVLTACVLWSDGKGKVRTARREFSTMTAGLRDLRAWLQGLGVTHVAMESTGVYWMPVYAVLEGAVDLTVANAQHIKNVPGRKTDMNDAEWIARLLRCGLLRKSFVPDAEVRAIRDLTRMRARLVQDRTREVNRLQKVLAQANIKLAAVISDIFGVSGLAMVKALVQGEQTPAQMAQLARGAMRPKIPQIEQALEGTLQPHHVLMLRTQLTHVEQIDAHLATLDAEVTRRFAPYEAQLALLDTIPGVSRHVAERILAELGVDLRSFADAHKLAAWAGVAPGNNQSAGKDRAAARRKGNVQLTTILVEAALAAARTKGTYLRDKYHRLKARRGAKRAALAIAHKLITSVYHVLTTGQPYKELGAHYLDQKDRDRTIRTLLRRLKGLGVELPNPTPPSPRPPALPVETCMNVA